jgi:hypothetical protein
MGHRSAAPFARPRVVPGPAVGRVVLISALIGLITLQPTLVGAQFGSVVFDPQNFTQNVRAAVALANQLQLTLRDLAPMANMGRALDVARQLNQLVSQVQSIATRMAGRRSLWNEPYLIESAAALAEFRSSSTQLCRTVTTEALSAQSLITEASDLLNTLTTLVDSIDVLAGSVAGLQAASVHLGSLGGHLTALQTLTAVNNEASLCDGWAKQVRREAVTALQIKLFSDHGQLRE